MDKVNKPNFLDKIIPENYTRAFFFKKLGFLLSDLVLFHYRKRNFLTIYDNDTLGTYIENSSAEWTLQNGKEIFSSEKNFTVFEAGYRQIIKESEKYLAHNKALAGANLGDFYDLQAIIVKLYYYFEKTEFFFTDACYEGEMSETLKKNLFTLGDDLKMTSRPLIVEILTTALYNLVDLTAKQFDLKSDDLRFYSFEQIRELYELGKIAPASLIVERQKSFVVYCTGGDRAVELSGEDKKSVIERFKEKDKSGVTEFKGTIASKGKITARARVVLPELDIPYEQFVKKLYSMEMNQGEILVTETTSPDFVPLMKKAGGIIANQGGLNSHAAIMSRELGIPCLVATHHATDILKTGDLIELDAEKGIVRIIK